MALVFSVESLGIAAIEDCFGNADGVDVSFASYDQMSMRSDLLSYRERDLPGSTVREQSGLGVNLRGMSWR